MHTLLKIVLYSTLVFSLCSCKKFLDQKSNEKLATIQSLDDLQEMIDGRFLNIGMDVNNSSTDEFFLTNSNWQSSMEIHQKAYIWDPELNDFDDWRDQYNTVFFANTVLDHLDKVPVAQQEGKANNVKGSALFFRSHAFYNIAQLFAPQYDASTASSDLGIPLRLNSNFNEASTRSSVQQTYDQIIDDLTEASSLLPDLPFAKTRPSKAAAYGMLARVYLQIGDYPRAKENADKCLAIYNTLLDYNDASKVNVNSIRPFMLFNEEVIFYIYTTTPITTFSSAWVDTTLYNSFADNDVRKKAFFRDNFLGGFRFKGSYNSSSFDFFQGIATDEIYLIRAECYARVGNTTAALNDLNTLLEKRFDNTFMPLTASNADDALVLVLQERKKQLMDRGLRWSDLRRLNKDPRFAVTLKRELNGTIYLLPPNDVRYTLLIPREVMNKTNLQQNPR